MADSLAKWMNRKLMRSRIVGAGYALIDGARLEPALFVSNPSESTFENIRFTGQEPMLFCERADAEALGVREGQLVEIPDEPGIFYIVDVNDDSGITAIELRKEP